MLGIADLKVAILATEGLSRSNLTEPVKALRAASAQVSVIAPARGQIQGINRHEKGDKVAVDHDLASVLPEQFEALVLPGGVANPDTLRTNPQAVSFVKHFVTKNKPIAKSGMGRGR
jgi:protease I